MAARSLAELYNDVEPAHQGSRSCCAVREHGTNIPQSGYRRRSNRVYVHWAVVWFAALFQPTYALFFGCFIACDIVSGATIRRTTLGAILMVLAAGLTIAPWCIRNYNLFGTAALTSGAGEAFWNGVHPAGNGGWTPAIVPRLQELESLNEMQRSKVLFAEGIEFVMQDPQRQIYKVVQKQLRLLGGDISSIQANADQRSSESRSIVRQISYWNNAFWLLLVCLMIAGISLTKFRPFWGNRLAACLTVPLLYFVVMHSVFQSESRHHVGLYVLISVYAAAIVSCRKEFPAAQARRCDLVYGA